MWWEDKDDYDFHYLDVWDTSFIAPLCRYPRCGVDPSPTAASRLSKGRASNSLPSDPRREAKDALLGGPLLAPVSGLPDRSGIGSSCVRSGISLHLLECVWRHLPV